MIIGTWSSKIRLLELSRDHWMSLIRQIWLLLCTGVSCRHRRFGLKLYDDLDYHCWVGNWHIVEQSSVERTRLLDEVVSRRGVVLCIHMTIHCCHCWCTLVVVGMTPNACWNGTMLIDITCFTPTTAIIVLALSSISNERKSLMSAWVGVMPVDVATSKWVSWMCVTQLWSICQWHFELMLDSWRGRKTR